MDATDPAQNIEIKPEDVITVPKGDIVYVVGTVRRSGGFVLTDHNGISSSKRCALAEGFDRFCRQAAPQNFAPTPGLDAPDRNCRGYESLTRGQGRGPAT